MGLWRDRRIWRSSAGSRPCAEFPAGPCRGWSPVRYATASFGRAQAFCSMPRRAALAHDDGAGGVKTRRMRQKHARRTIFLDKPPFAAYLGRQERHILRTWPPRRARDRARPPRVLQVPQDPQAHRTRKPEPGAPLARSAHPGLPQDFAPAWGALPRAGKGPVRGTARKHPCQDQSSPQQQE